MELIMIPKLKSAIIQIKSNVKLVEILSNQLEFDLKSKIFLQVIHCQSDFSFHQLSQNMTTDFQGTYLNCKCWVQVFVLGPEFKSLLGNVNFFVLFLFIF